MVNDFKPVQRRGDDQDQSARVDKSLRDLPVALPGGHRHRGRANIYKQFSPDFFDLIVIDECHRGSAAEDSAWREILDYFSGGHPDRPDRHAQGDEGRLQHPLLRRAGLHLLAAPGHRGRLPRALQGRAHRPRQGPAGLAAREGKTDKHGQLIEDRIYNQKRLRPQPRAGEAHRTRRGKITEFLKATDPSPRPSSSARTSTTPSACARRW
jgi:type I restriction enzyme R subunit